MSHSKSFTVILYSYTPLLDHKA
uniref:Uncharacterized protein n=1 Tax=Rhizophora mucronata TaxID=61149 RepID=A0A2P2N759_RHIMU